MRVTETTSTKTYEHAASVAFRQWRADSHCRFVHGYSLSFRFVFGCSQLDHRGWVVDFGGLKPLKAWIEETFDHRLLVAADDPFRDMLERLDVAAADVSIVDAVGMEAFARMAFDAAAAIVGPLGRWVESVEVWEHAGNSAKVTNVYPRQ